MCKFLACGGVFLCSLTCQTEHKMKGVVVENVEGKQPRTSFGQIPKPMPRANRVLVKVEACGICMSDVEVVDGLMPEPFVKVCCPLYHTTN